LAILFARASQGISYPNLYLNSAASPIALWTEALASAMEPVITQPTEGDSLKMWDTEEGSMSLSYGTSILVLRLKIEMEGGLPYRDLLLRQYNRTVLSSDTNRHDIRSSDGLEGIFYPPTTR
jgi:hypothetical protein